MQLNEFLQTFLPEYLVAKIVEFYKSLGTDSDLQLKAKSRHN